MYLSFVELVLQALPTPPILFCVRDFKANPTGFLTENTQEKLCHIKRSRNHLLRHMCVTHRCLATFHGCHNFVTVLGKSGWILIIVKIRLPSFTL